MKALPPKTVPQDIAGTVDIAGPVALSTCEALMLSLNKGKFLPEKEIVGIMKDVAAAHEFAPEGADTP